MSNIQNLHVTDKFSSLTTKLYDVQLLISASQKKLATIESSNTHQAEEFAEFQQLVLTTNQLQNQINENLLNLYKTYRKECDIQYDKIFNEFTQSELRSIKQIRKIAWALGAVAIMAIIALIIACVGGI